MNRFAELRAGILALLLVGLTGCASLMEPKPSAPATPAARPTPAKKPEIAVSVDTQRRFEQAMTALKAGQNKEAEAQLLDLTRREPRLAGPWANLGILYFRTQRPKEAMNALNKAIEINPDQPAYYNELGIIQREEGKFAEARRSYERALAVDPAYAPAQLNLGILYDLYLQEPDKALLAYQRYRELVPAEGKTVAKWIADLEQRLRKSAEKKS